MYTLTFLAPILVNACISGILSRGRGLVCNIETSREQVLQYERPKPEESCYRDGIFYPRCKDLENPQVLYYHNLFKSEAK